MHRCCTSAINDCQVLAKQKNITVNMIATDKELQCLLDYHWCYRALVNLISNAIGYANHFVNVEFTLINNELTITVADDGKGVSEDKIDIIFNPFVKLDADRSREQSNAFCGDNSMVM